VGYAPKENPEIAVVALAEHSCHGASAAPIVRDVIEAYIDKQNLEKGILPKDEKAPAVKQVKGHQLPFEEMDE
jgi:penicillin-binding protein 2